MKRLLIFTACVFAHLASIMVLAQVPQGPTRPSPARRP